jgi:CheY-like chemotaxis protein
MEEEKEVNQTLLLVDDVDLFLQLQISYLGNRRFDIHTAKSGAEALEKARNVKPDLILLDMFMPDITGDAVCRILKGDPETASIPIIIVSSGTKDDTRKRCETAGCDGLIYKPVRKDLLLSVVEKFLGIHIRRSQRVRVSLKAVIIFHDVELPATIRSLSVDGAFAEVESGNMAGDLVEVRLNLPDAEEEIFIRTAAVVWCGTLDKGGSGGMGLRFLSIHPKSANQINRYVKLVSEEGGGGSIDDRSSEWATSY